MENKLIKLSVSTNRLLTTFHLLKMTLFERSENAKRR